MQKQSMVVGLLVFGMLLTGSINTVAKKMGYNTCSHGLSSVHATSDAHDDCHGDERKFQKPWTQTLVMFLGESMCMWLFLYNRKAALRREAIREAEPLLAQQSPPLTTTYRLNLRSVGVCFLPALCDLGGTTLSGIGLLFTTASVFQMLRGSIIVFTAIFSVVFLKRKVKRYQWFGIFITVCGIAMVGGASYLHTSSKSSTSTTLVMVGNLLVILSQTMSATQMVVEEKFLKGRKLPPEFVVGCEGIFGALTMLILVLPLVAHIPFHSCNGKNWCLDGGGIHENALDALELMRNNGLLFFLVGLYWVSIAFYNFCGLAVAKRLSSVHRTLVDACRTLVVWVADLILYYSTSGKYGEAWNTKPGVLQLCGFLVMVVGTAVYNGIIKVPGFEYASANAEGSNSTNSRREDSHNNGTVLLQESTPRED